MSAITNTPPNESRGDPAGPRADTIQDLKKPAPHTVYVLDRKGFIIDTNEAVAPLTSESQEDLIGNHIAAYFDPQTREALKAFIRDQDNQTQLVIAQAVIRDRFGHEHQVAGRVYSLWENNEGVIGFVIRLEQRMLQPEFRGARQSSEDAGRDENLMDRISEAIVEINHNLTLLKGILESTPQRPAPPARTAGNKSQTT